MKKTGLINGKISSVISQLGHTDYIVIGDAGLPIPNEIPRIDLAITKGMPPFEIVLKTILSELYVESWTIASEASDAFEVLCGDIIAQAQQKNIRARRIPHSRFKQLTQHAKAVIRTGEASPYYNVILYSGVTF